jgi:hypothetical protein
MGEALLAAWLIERYFGLDFSFDRLRNVLGLLAAAVVATAASGIGGTVAFKLFHSPTAPNAAGVYAQLVAAHVGERGAVTSRLEESTADLEARILITRAFAIERSSNRTARQTIGC